MIARLLVDYFIIMKRRGPYSRLQQPSV